jgi:hypothetical protein
LAGTLWPPDFPKPADVTLGRWLDRARDLGQVVQQGTGKKSDPFRYALAGKEEEWKKDPLYEFNRKFEEDRRKIYAEVGLPWPPVEGKF